MTLIRKGLGALKKPLKRRGTEEAEERGKLPELPRLPNIAENRKGKPLPLLDTDNTDRGIGNPDLRFKGASDHGDHPIMRDYPLLSLSSAFSVPQCFKVLSPITAIPRDDGDFGDLLRPALHFLAFPWYSF
jgi:hypothetical protein